jgi:ribosomal protein S4
LKQLVIVTIEGPSHNDTEQARQRVLQACLNVRDNLNNGASMKVSTGMKVGIADWLKGWIGNNSTSEQGKKKKRKARATKSIDEMLMDL